LEIALAERSIEIGPGGCSPYGDEWGLWHEVSVTFDEPSLRARLHLDDCVTYEEYDGRVAGSDATFYCKLCKRAIMGLHPRYAPRGTVRVA
jgi:hypothetical protein